MNWQDALAEVESPQFAARINVVSGERAFFQAIAQNPVVRDMYRHSRDSGELREEVLGRIQDLAAADIDRRYENPNDTPLAVLLWLTCRTAPDFVQVAAQYTARAPQCWYARNLAQRIIALPTAEGTNSWEGGEGKVATVSMLPVDAKVKVMPAAATGPAQSKIGEYTFGAVN